MAAERQEGLEAILRQAPVVPVLVIDDVADAVPLAKALVEGGLTVLEITLRTEAAPSLHPRHQGGGERCDRRLGHCARRGRVEAQRGAGLRFCRLSRCHAGPARGRAQDRGFRFCRLRARPARRWRCSSRATACRNSFRLSNRAVLPISRRWLRPCRKSNSARRAASRRRSRLHI